MTTLRFPYLRRFKSSSDESSKGEGEGSENCAISNTSNSSNSKSFWIIFGSIAFYISVYLFFLAFCIVFLTVTIPPTKSTWHKTTPQNEHAQPVFSQSPLSNIPSDDIWKESLSPLDSVEIKLASESDSYSLRLKILDSVYDNFKNLTTLRLALGQTLLITPKLTAFLNENGKLVGITSTDREAGTMMTLNKEGKTNINGRDVVVEEVAEMLRTIVNEGYASSSSRNNKKTNDTSISPPEADDDRENTIATNSIGNSTYRTNSGGSRRLSRGNLARRLILFAQNQSNRVRRLGKHKNHQSMPNTNIYRPGFYGAMPYPYRYPVSQAPLYQRPFEHIPQPPPQYVYQPPLQNPLLNPIQPVYQPQQVFAAPNLQPQLFVQPQPVQPIAVVPPAPLPVAPQPPATLPNDELTPGDLEVLSELIKVSNEQLTEQILDLTIKREDLIEKPKNLIDGDTLITVDALDKLAYSLTSDRPHSPDKPHEEILDLSFNPNNDYNNGVDMESYVNGFTDGYRDGFGNGIETGEELTTSLWCSIDSSHPLCDNRTNGVRRGARSGNEDSGVEGLLAGVASGNGDRPSSTITRARGY